MCQSQWRIQGGTGPLILDQTKIWLVGGGLQKNFWRPPPRLHFQSGWKRLQRIEAKFEGQKSYNPTVSSL